MKNLYRKLLKQQKVSFPPKGEKLKATDKKGVYIIYDPKGNVAHVGCTPRAKKGVRQRLGNHLAGLSSFVGKYLKNDSAQLRKGFQFRYIELDDSRQRKLVEALAMGCLCPKHVGEG